MQGTVLAIGIFCSFLVVALRPKHALVVYITALLWFPEFLRFSIGTIDISLGRFVVAVLLLRCLSNNSIRSKFKWTSLDTWVTGSMIVYVGAVLVTQPTMASIENRSGFVMDTWFSYLVARFIITDRHTLISVIKCVAIVLVPLTILGCIETFTGWQPFLPLRRFKPWLQLDPQAEFTKVVRWGLVRAVGPFNHPILFGSGFAIFLPLIYYLHYEKRPWRILAYILSATVILGAFTSMSVGPWVMVAVAIFCLAMEKHKTWVKPMILFFVFTCVATELLSNRPFYHVFTSYASKLGGAGWHRAKLIDVAIKHFNEWWLIGYSGKDPGWGPYFGMSRTDVTNEYIAAGVRYGMAGVIALCGVLYVAFRGLVNAYKKTIHPATKSLYWALGSMLSSVAVTWMAAHFFGQLLSLFYCLLGVIGSCSLFTITQKVKFRKVLINNSSKRIMQETINRK
jgi:hypothetical protein